MLLITSRSITLQLLLRGIFPSLNAPTAVQKPSLLCRLYRNSLGADDPPDVGNRTPRSL